MPPADGLAGSVLSKGYAGAAMKLEIEQRQNEGIFILDLKGRLVLGPEDLAVRQRLQTLLDAGRHNVIVNLKEVSDIDSTGLGTLVTCALRFRDSGGKLVLLHLSDSQARLPDILKLNAVFESYQNEVQAVNSFFPDRKINRYDILDFVEEQEQRR
jgi:anti-sigma B factor antagonist